ncbi:MAG: restriction endonuclease subunit S, partial [Bacteroidota bacterium]|nr:restriction endonuclease subunit S [Bacteroidota bacterium]
YLKYYLNSERVYAQIRCRMDGAAITRLTITKLNEIPISYPSLQEQKIIVAKLESFESNFTPLISNYQQTILRCEEMKKAVLAKAFNGEL